VLRLDAAPVKRVLLVICTVTWEPLSGLSTKLLVAGLVLTMSPSSEESARVVGVAEGMGLGVAVDTAAEVGVASSPPSAVVGAVPAIADWPCVEVAPDVASVEEGLFACDCPVLASATFVFTAGLANTAALMPPTTTAR
jgi:hypothetical protein